MYQPYVRQWGVGYQTDFLYSFPATANKGAPPSSWGQSRQTWSDLWPSAAWHPPGQLLSGLCLEPRPPTPDGPPVRLGPGFAHTRGPDTLFPSCGASSGLPQTSALTLSSLVRPPRSPFCCLKPRASPSLQFLKGHTDLGLNLSSGI